MGLAKILQGGYVSGVVGTLAWSAPELLLGHRCTAKADVYSFGVVLWCALGLWRFGWLFSRLLFDGACCTAACT